MILWDFTNYSVLGLLVLAEMAVSKYIEEVKNKTFPGEEYSYPIKEEKLKKVKLTKYWKS